MVIPGRREAAGRDPYAAALVVMDSGLVHLRPSGFGGRPGMTKSVADGSRPQPLALQALVQAGDLFTVAVVDQRRAALAGADDFLARLAPARMRHGRIDVGPEAVFGRLQRLPHADRALVD